MKEQNIGKLSLTVEYTPADPAAYSNARIIDTCAEQFFSGSMLKVLILIVL